GPFAAPLLHFGDPIKKREEEEAEAAAKQNKGTGPQIFVDGKPRTAAVRNVDPRDTKAPATQK
ncbi:MAG: hypothetical protein WB556_23005, partial [Candidatus Acidiferrum sp.]